LSSETWSPRSASDDHYYDQLDRTPPKSPPHYAPVSWRSEKDYEAQIERSFDNGEWKPVKNLKKERARYREAAAETLLKNRRVNIRISAMDLEGLQAKAAAEGLPYQTLIEDRLHQAWPGPVPRRPLGRAL